MAGRFSVRGRFGGNPEKTPAEEALAADGGAEAAPDWTNHNLADPGITVLEAPSLEDRPLRAVTYNGGAASEDGAATETGDPATAPDTALAADDRQLPAAALVDRERIEDEPTVLADVEVEGDLPLAGHPEPKYDIESDPADDNLDGEDLLDA
jgi:hypothetical protein